MPCKRLLEIFLELWIYFQLYDNFFTFAFFWKKSGFYWNSFSLLEVALALKARKTLKFTRSAGCTLIKYQFHRPWGSKCEKHQTVIQAPNVHDRKLRQTLAQYNFGHHWVEGFVEISILCLCHQCFISTKY